MTTIGILTGTVVVLGATGYVLALVGATVAVGSHNKDSRLYGVIALIWGIVSLATSCSVLYVGHLLEGLGWT